MRTERKLAFPAITICNLAPTVPLHQIKCHSFDNERSCPEQHPNPTLPHCLVYNNDQNTTDKYTAAKKGLADALMIVLQINTKMYPASSRFSGVHINLHRQCIHAEGTCPEEMSSNLMAAPGRPRFYRMTKVVTEFANGTSRWLFEAKDSDAGNFNFDATFGRRQDTVVLVFYFASMSEMVVTELPRFTWLTMGAEVGGVMGLLFGVGVINISTFLLRWCFKGRQHLYHAIS